MKPLAFVAAGIFAVVAMWLAVAWAQTGPFWTAKSTSVSSSTVPVAIVTPGAITSFTIHPRSASATGVLIFPYSSPLPTAVPTGAMEVPPGAYYGDTTTATYKDNPPLPGQGFAAALPTGSSTITVDSMTR